MNSPTVNVNLKACDCPPSDVSGQRHETSCASAPINVPTPIPRAFTCAVVLGECTCAKATLHSTRRWHHGEHPENCPARPVKVSCHISGKMWEESEVDLSSVEPSDPLADRAECMAACRARWALVKALVLGKTWREARPDHIEWQFALFQQRDAVFEALADVARHEEALYRRQNDALRAINGSAIMVPEPHNRPSAFVLDTYVRHLIVQVGILTGGQ